ncbi:hypothetical protein PR048_025746 [Dryococelus australis]|uniref:Major facilitator superfamily (MFS) profile domain-containing protein n=1 Tax=Dryococelus australis TaxID=614101 RepID=A0ABQ9GJE7_9NEOP|nr:hypothetical protein PR048_025746 [Dryococelus australis]
MSIWYIDNLILKRDVHNEKSKKALQNFSWTPVHFSRSNSLKYVQPRFLPQVKAAVLSCWVNLASGASMAYVTPALQTLQLPDSGLALSDSQASWVASLSMLGAFLGGISVGPCIALGRRRALWLVALPLAVSWALVAAATAVWHLCLAQFLSGICMAITADASQVYVSETVSAERRGSLGCVPMLMFNLGTLACWCAGAWLPWDQLAMFCAALALPSLLLPLWFPESPSYLVAHSRTQQALHSLYQLRGKRCDINFEYQELLQCDKGTGFRESMRHMCDNDLLKPLFIMAAVRILSRFCGLRAILTYTKDLLHSTHSVLDERQANIIIGSVQLAATLFGSLVVDKLGRRNILMASQFVMGMSLAALGSFFYFFDESDCAHNSALSWVPLAAILVYIVCNSVGLSPVSGILIGELVPQRYRHVTSSLTGAASWLSAFIVTKTFVDLDRYLHLYGTMWLYCLMCFLGVVFVFFALPETRGLSQYAIDVLFVHSVEDDDEEDYRCPPPTTRRHSSLKSVDINENQTRL